MRSCLYHGRVRHRRHEPVEHAFSYRLFMPYLDLDAASEAFRGRWLWSVDRPNLACLRRRDHFGDPALPLADAVRALVAERIGRVPAGPVTMLAHLRYFGHCFNPVSFFFCWDEGGEALEAIVAEVRNTPWKETHGYVLDARRSTGRPLRFEFAKDFHVSPFMPMAQRYRWTFGVPGPRLAVHMENIEDGRRVLDATMVLERRPLTGPNLAAALTRHPFMTVGVIAAIYRQALRLKLKGAPFHAHPGRRVTVPEDTP